MKAIVFGGSGFVGSHVADVLSDKGMEVTIFDLQKSPYLRENQSFIKGNCTDQNLDRRRHRVAQGLQLRRMAARTVGAADGTLAHGQG